MAGDIFEGETKRALFAKCRDGPDKVSMLEEGRDVGSWVSDMREDPLVVTADRQGARRQVMCRAEMLYR